MITTHDKYKWVPDELLSDQEIRHFISLATEDGSDAVNHHLAARMLNRAYIVGVNRVLKELEVQAKE